MKPPFKRPPVAAAAALVVALLTGCATGANPPFGPSDSTAAADADTAPSAGGTSAGGTSGAAPAPRAAGPRASQAARAPQSDADDDEDDDDDEPLPQVELNPQVLYQLLASEVAVQRGQTSAAAASYLTLARQTRDPRIARRAVELALTERSLERAASAAQVWLEIAPGSRRAAQTLEALYLSNGQYLLAEPLLVKRLAAAREAGTVADVYPGLARLLLRTPDRTAANALIERVSEPDAGVPQAWVARAAVAHAAEQFDAAAQAARRALELAPDSEEIAVTAARHLQRTPEGTQAALALLRDFVARQPRAQEARFALGRLYSAEGEHALARAQFERLLADAGDNPATLFSLAQVSYQAKQPRDAERYLRRYLALPPAVQRDDGPAYLFLAQLAEDDKRLPEAIDWLGRVQSGEQFLPALVRRALLLGKLDRIDDARALLRDASVSSTRERVQLTLAEAQVLRDAGRHQEVLELLSRALERQPDEPDLLYEHAMAAERLGRLPEMETGLRRLIVLRPDHAHAYNALGYSLADRGLRLPEAQALIEKALSLAPEDPFILDSMGWVHFRMGQLDRAIEYLQKAYQLKPEAEIAAHLGEVLWAAGRADEAKRLWREARGREPNNETLNGTLARLNVSL